MVELGWLGWAGWSAERNRIPGRGGWRRAKESRRRSAAVLASTGQGNFGRCEDFSAGSSHRLWVSRDGGKPKARLAPLPASLLPGCACVCARVAFSISAAEGGGGGFWLFFAEFLLSWWLIWALSGREEKVGERRGGLTPRSWANSRAPVLSSCLPSLGMRVRLFACVSVCACLLRSQERVKPAGDRRS